VAVWNSNEDLGGMAGTDADIFVSTTWKATRADFWDLFY
jgi:hypothetical protein